MRKLAPLLLLCLFSISCKKAIEKKKEQVVMDAITSGVWYVELYSENNIQKTSEYNGYEFKFNENETLNALRSGSSVTGTWKPNIAEYSITTNFPGAADPLDKLSSIWTLLDSDWDYVKAESTILSVRRELHLRKK